jgi:Transposase DDE domain
MSDSLSLYRTIIDLLRAYQVQFHDFRCLITFAWSIVGVILEKSVHMSKWSIHRQGEAKAASKQRQFARWLNNARIEPGEIYQRLARAAFGTWQGQRIYLALDTSCLWGEYVLVRVAVIYRGRALPVSWVVLRHASAMVGFDQYQSLLDQAAAILPQGCQVVLLADRGFDDNALLCKVRDLGWSFCIRLRKTIRVYRVDRRPTSIRFLMPAKGQALFLHKVWITDRQLGPVHLALAYAQTANGYQDWAIVSDLPTGLHTFDEYGLRFDVEESFLDDKSAGFQIESGEVRDAQALTRLGLILATATLFLVSTGTAVLTLGIRAQVDPHWQRGLSYFQIGWRWIRYALANFQTIHSFFWFEPGSDPHPVFASKRQAAIPIATLTAINLEIM